MSVEEQVKKELSGVLVPRAMRSLEQLNLVREVEVSGQKVNITLASAALNEETQGRLKTEVSNAIQKIPGIVETEISFVDARPKELNEIGHVVAVMSGKGGVGKSLVVGLLATALTCRGHDVGILDADITGPSIPKMFGMSTRPTGSDTGIAPVLSGGGVGIMSINLLLPQEDDAVIWRGPLIGKAITQFWEDVLWGRLDYLIVDLPPGTADAPLTVMQSLPVSGIIIVSSPQELATMVVRKAVKMARDSMHVPILGVVENMSYLTLPDTGKRLEVFGKSRGEEMAKSAGAPLLAQIPIDPSIAQLCDEGNIERYDSELLSSFADAFAKAVSSRAK